ncbi:MAG: hypothetical protein ABW164_04445 [Sphingobium sp.]
MKIAVASDRALLKRRAAATVKIFAPGAEVAAESHDLVSMAGADTAATGCEERVVGPQYGFVLPSTPTRPYRLPSILSSLPLRARGRARLYSMRTTRLAS